MLRVARQRHWQVEADLAQPRCADRDQQRGNRVHFTAVKVVNALLDQLIAREAFKGLRIVLRVVHHGPILAHRRIVRTSQREIVSRAFSCGRNDLTHYLLDCNVLI